MRRLVRPEEALFLIYIAVVCVVMAMTHTWTVSTNVQPWLFLAFLLLVAAVVFRRGYLEQRLAHPRGTAARRALGPAATVARDFLPFFFILFLYETLHDLTPVLRPVVVDDVLIAIDRRLFGTDLAWWLGRCASPPLTAAMVFCYSSYFVAPGLFATLAYFRGERRLFRDYLVTMSCVTVLGYVGYLLVPAVGPYVHQAALFPTRLPGRMSTQFFVSTIDDLRGIARDCFPSLHTAHTTCVLVFAWRMSRRVFWAYLPVAAGLVVSTLYLRYHYGIDVVAGFVTAAVAVAVGPRIERWWHGAGVTAMPRRDTATGE